MMTVLAPAPVGTDRSVEYARKLLESKRTTPDQSGDGNIIGVDHVTIDPRGNIVEGELKTLPRGSTYVEVLVFNDGQVLAAYPFPDGSSEGFGRFSDSLDRFSGLLN